MGALRTNNLDDVLGVLLRLFKIELLQLLMQLINIRFWLVNEGLTVTFA